MPKLCICQKEISIGGLRIHKADIPLCRKCLEKLKEVVMKTLEEEKEG